MRCPLLPPAARPLGVAVATVVCVPCAAAVGGLYLCPSCNAEQHQHRARRHHAPQPVGAEVDADATLRSSGSLFSTRSGPVTVFLLLLLLLLLQTLVSGRFEALGDILNGKSLLFPYLRRRVEGRALRAVGPPTEEVPTSDGGSRAVVTFSGAVAQVVAPPRWPREVQDQREL